MTEQELPTPAKNKWYKKWWVWVLIAFGVLIVAGALGSTAEEDAAAPGSTTSTSEASESTTTVEDATTTTDAPETTTTTQPPTTTTTLPPILAQAEDTGDNVVLLSIPEVPVVIEITHNGSSNFAVLSLDSSFETIDLLVNQIGNYDGTRTMQLASDEVVSVLEITADGDWRYEIRPLLQEPMQTCQITGSGDDVVLLGDFLNGGGAADLTHDGDSNFSILAWGADGRDLLVNEIGSYTGTVRVSSGLFVWDITADGNWTVDC